MAKGEERGFYLVEFDRRITNINFEAIEVADVVELEYSADERSSREALEEIQKVARSTDIHGKVVLLKVGGQLASGHTSDIDFSEIRKTLLSRGPISVLLNYSQLTSRERSLATGLQRSAQATEREMFSRRIGSVTTSRPNLRGERGVGTSVELLKTLKAEKRENENKADYQDRTERAGLSVLGIGEEP